MTNNPFQIQLKPFIPKTESEETPKKMGWKSVVSISLASIGFLSAVALVYGNVSGDFPTDLSLKSSFAPQGGTSRVMYRQHNEVSLVEARKRYRQALLDQKAGQFDQALSAWKSLEPVYPGLQEFLWLHQAESYEGLGNEWAVQKKLKSILERFPSTPVKTFITYRMGQSHFRATEWDEARRTFEKLVQQAPKSEYAIGSLYYLGELSLKSGEQKAAVNASQAKKAVDYFTQYVTQCPNCTFSAEAARGLHKLLSGYTAKQHQLIGIALSSAPKPQEAELIVTHLKQAELQSAWLTLGKVQLESGDLADGRKSLLEGLKYAASHEEAQSAIELLLSKDVTVQQKVERLTNIVHQSPSFGVDYALWRLAEVNPKQAGSYYNTIVKFYPRSDYAPESKWQLLRVLVQQNSSAYIGGASAFLQQYGYARSAPKVQFWLAKFLEKSDEARAVKTYTSLVSHYSDSYYAFRAIGRLNVLRGNTRDTGWQTSPNRTLPGAVTETFAQRLSTIQILPEQGAFSKPSRLRNQALELQAIQAPEDLALLVKSESGEIPVLIDSWIAHAANNPSKGIRVIRDAIAKERKEAFQRAQAPNSVIGPVAPSSYPPLESSDSALQLMYPDYYREKVYQYSLKNKIDPLLAQSLMREESYFNALAVSGSDARGLMQLLPSTAQEVAGWEKIAGFNANDLFLPETNIQLGARYLGYLHERFKGKSMHAVGAYNGGPGAMSRWMNASKELAVDPDRFVENIPYEQSRHYIEKVFGSYWNYKRLYDKQH